MELQDEIAAALAKPLPKMPAAEFTRAWKATRELEIKRRVEFRFTVRPGASLTPFVAAENVDALTAIGLLIDALGLDAGCLMPRRLVEQGRALAILLCTPEMTPNGKGCTLKTRVVAYVVEGLDETELLLGLSFWDNQARGGAAS